MAKDKKTAAQAAEVKNEQNAQVEITSENVMDQVRANNLQNDTAVAAAMAEIEKEKDEKKKRDAMHAIKKHQYKNVRALIELRKRRAEDKVTKKYLADTKETLDQYLAGKLTATEAEEKDRKDEREKSEGFRKVDEQFSKDIKELRDAYPGYWSYEWDRCW